MRGGALIGQGQGEAGIIDVQHGLAAFRALGSEVTGTVWQAYLAQAHVTGRQPEEGLKAVREGLSLVARHSERYWEAELYRLKGELLLQQSGSDSADVSEVEACFHQALDIAGQQEAKSWELRAATSLARLWQSHGKLNEARELLAPVHEWFTEGFDTADLVEAKALLEALSTEIGLPTT